MSGSPNMQDIALLRNALEVINRERETIERAQKQKETEELRIDQAQQRLRKSAEEVKCLMEAMDCASPGNFGYENRMMALLTGMAKHAEEYGRQHP